MSEERIHLVNTEISNGFMKLCSDNGLTYIEGVFTLAYALSYLVAATAKDEKQATEHAEGVNDFINNTVVEMNREINAAKRKKRKKLN